MLMDEEGIELAILGMVVLGIIAVGATVLLVRKAVKYFIRMMN